MPSTAAPTVPAQPTTGATTPAPHWVSTVDHPGLLLITGHLSPATHRGVREGRPYLMVLFTCPGCHCVHGHRWSEAPAPTIEPGMAILRRSHCSPLSRLHARDVLVQPSPFDGERNGRLVEEVNRAFKRYQANRALDEQRAADRKRGALAQREIAKWDGYGATDPEALIVTRGKPARWMGRIG